MKVNKIATGLILLIMSIGIRISPAEVPFETDQGKSADLKVATANRDQEILNLLSGSMPSQNTSKKLRVKAGLGQNWDYASYLREGEGQNNQFYKRRLKLLRYQLHTLCNPSITNEEIDSRLRIDLIRHLKGFCNTWALLKLTAATRFADQIALAGFIPMKEGACSEVKTSVGTVLRFAKNLNSPLYYVTDPDAITICIRLHKLQSKIKPSPEAFNKIISEMLSNKNLGFQSRLMLEHCINLNCEKSEFLSSTVPTSKEREAEIFFMQNSFKNNLPEGTREDLKKLKVCLSNLSHHNVLTSIGFKLFLTLAKKQPFFCKKGNEIFVDQDVENVFLKLQSYLPILDDLQKEYSSIYQRISEELKKKKGSGKKKVQINQAAKSEPESKASKVQGQKKSDQISSVKVKETKNRAEAITYDRRVLRWFKQSFYKRKPESRVRYHTMLPCCCDLTIINCGEHKVWPNRTYQGQLDDHYRSAGKVVWDDGTEEFYIFDVCLDPKGICYHRGCKKVSYDQLVPELKKSVDIVEEEDPDFTEESDNFDMEAATVVKETDFYTLIYNPVYHCNITLCKSL